MLNKKSITTLIVISLLLSSIFMFCTSQDIMQSLGDINLSQGEKTTLPVFQSDKVKNVIFMIGDGMSITTITAARISAYGADGKLTLERFPFTGIQNTYCLDRLVTDSGASGTALATGYKTNYGMISILPDSTKLQTILEALKLRGKLTGIVATSSVTHATPASFSAHNLKRGNETEIAEDIVNNNINVIMGGGRHFFIPQSTEGSKRKDEKNLINEAKESGYEVISTKSELQNSTSGKILALFQLDAMQLIDSEPSLAEMTEKAIEKLSGDEDGFFLMVEASQIDWAAHDNLPEQTLTNMLNFDKAIEKAVNFALNDGETLVVVTADHETGGMTINGGRLNGDRLNLKWTTTGHTGVSVPVFAFGPQGEKFTGWYENTDIPKKIAAILGIEDFAIVNH
ncbi:alkaline phosphatase [candidate division KSB1 bacterium]